MTTPIPKWPRYRAKLDDFPLRLESIEDAFERSLVKHEYPGLDGASLDDLGMQGRKIKFRAVFWDHVEIDGNYSYDDHVLFVNYIQTPDLSLKLQHPHRGLVRGRMESVSVRYDDKRRVAYVDVGFCEEVLDREAHHIPVLVTPGAEDRYVSGQAAQMERWTDKVKKAFGESGSILAAAQIDPDEGLLSQISGISGAARQFVTDLDEVISTMEGALVDIANPAESILATIEFGTQLPGRVIGAVANTVERYALAVSALTSSPVQIMSSFYSGIDQLKAAFSKFDNGSETLMTSDIITGSTTELTKKINPYNDEIDVSAALYGALILAAAYQADEINRDVMRKNEGLPVFDAAGRFIPAPQPPEIFTVTDLERSLAIMRERLQLALFLNRGMTELSDLAMALLEHVNTIKVERERLILTDVDTSMPIHALCLRHGLSYSFAERLMSVNQQVRNPSFSRGTMAVYAR